MRERSKWMGLTAAVVVSLSAGMAGVAQAAPQDEKAVAEVLFLEGQRLLAAGQVQAACAKFEESERHDHAIGTLLNLGNCYEKTGRTASAWATFKEVVDMAVAAHDTTREQYAKQRAAALAPRLSKLTIVVPAEVNTEGVVIRRDGVQVGSALWGVAVPVDPGQHKIEVAAPGRRTWSTVANVEPDGSQSTVPIPALDRDPSATNTPPVPTTSTTTTATTTPETPPDTGSSNAGSTQRIIAYSVGGLGIVSLAVGSVMGLVAKSKNDDALTHCNNDRCDATGLSLTNDAQSAATVSTIMFVAGAALVAGGVVLYFTAPKKSGIALTPAVGPRSAGLSLGGAF